jgi:voltage-gated potassium channel
MYFTITVIGTVGFGATAAKSDIARVIVSIQIVLDLGVLVGLVRTIVFAARVGVRRQYSDRMPSEPGDGT